MNDKPAEKLNNDSLNGQPESANSFDGLGAELEKNLSQAVKAEMDDMTEQEMVEIYENSNTLKGMVAKRKKELTDEHEEQRRKKKVMAFKLGTVVCLLGVIMIFASIAWFTMNREVGTGGMSMKTGTLPFELITYGSISPNSGIVEEIGYKSGSAVTSGASSAGVGNIKWLLEPTDDMAKDGLRPGTSGSLLFVVEPKDKDVTKKLEVKYTLSLTAYKLNDEKKEEIAEANARILDGEDVTMPTVTLDDLIELSDDPSDANYTKGIDYIKGHIIFFNEEDNSGRFGIGETQTVEFNTANVKEIPLHWIWPETIGNMVSSGSSFVNICTGDEKTALVQFIQNNPGLFFEISDLDAEMIEAGKLKSNVLGEDLSDYYPTLNLAYDNADQVIGVNVQYILIELIVEGSLKDAD